MLSVVVPFYNVADYIGECLASLAAQTLRDVEFVLVDDGSEDGSAAIAAEFAAGDPRFRILRQETMGPGPARNLGVRHARGTYLAFADSDDVVPERAYEALVGSLEETGSDIACGAVRRLTPDGLVPSSLHVKLFRKPRQRTHITGYPDLTRDRTVWNKVYRRSFWDERGLAFPAGLYEDAPVAVAAHVLASGVDLLNEVVYHWRLRETGDASITQRRMEVSNLEERVASLRGVQLFLAERAPRIKRAFDEMIATWDVRFLYEALEDADEGEARRLLDAVVPCVEALHPSVVAGLGAGRRLELHLLRRRMLPELREVLRFRREEEVRVVRRGIRNPRWYAAYPFFEDRSRDIPAHVYEVTRELVLRVHTDRVRWSGGRLLVEGRASIKRLDERHSKIKVWLSGRKKARIALPVHQEGAAFVTDVAVGKPGRWSLHVEVSSAGMRQSDVVRVARRQLPRGGRGRVRAALGKGGRLAIRVRAGG
ncbi:CDP-glycerol glycerophosphotransferase [Streptosporangium becharense]|uniref:glycosyltransferase family 2 protein n=1 Tax=Streptosporangium becharense TaxID=1816182 RepID=UPI001618296F|nr:glycosyltransferase family 2 protein [Streptosporangium becharense]MBB2909536.1 CDP-glycerol glycerophosphotransferase [Streptosporangium becharense]